MKKWLQVKYLKQEMQAAVKLSVKFDVKTENLKLKKQTKTNNGSPQ